ncbi:hypothetical protein B0T14DRAFT_506057 [Immersiella caudata]|uniref:Zn(2)-C6 fungal-type domain-containing protein n=1 Tax=Immersiella caudata TaxID=314043 RepID=A0AA40CD88_9PEZI|nr:hypothetical protein B0T14DRAFT_506057 [Immersiella caudata]
MADLATPLAQRPRPQKRRRPALACEQCRARKVRCDRATPCNTCVRSSNPDCTYTPLPPQGGPKERRSLSPASIPGRPPAPTPSDSIASLEIVSLEGRTKYLEQEHRFSNGAEQPKLHEGPCSSEEGEKNFVPLRIRGTMSKTRFFGHSHWATGANLVPAKYKALLHLMDRAQHEKTSRIYAGFQKSKKLARAIKRRRSAHLLGLTIGQNVPDRHIADALTDGYLRTFETIHRLLHIPSFRTEYGRYWDEPERATQSFVVLVQLCMAVGACFHDDKHSFRAQATRWIYEARLWLLITPEKAQLSMVGLQIMCLLQFAKQTTGLAGDLTWISAGSLLRAAMSMGLNHDPETLVRMPPLRVELRRRLWATILEINLQASLDAGALPLISPSDFTTKPPRNVHEEDLTNELNPDTLPDVEPSIFTANSIQVALHRSFTTRLAIVNHINQSSPPSYEATLRLSSELLSSTRALFQHLHSHPLSLNPPTATAGGIFTFQLRFLEMLMTRYLLALHLPWWNSSLHNPTHYFSRKTSVDAARAIVSLSQVGPSPNPSLTDFDRLLVCASGPFRSTPIHACLTLTLEYIHLKEESQKNKGLTFSNATARETEELRKVFNWQSQWWVRRIRAGETNVKTYAFGGVFESCGSSPATVYLLTWPPRLCWMSWA